MKLPGTMTNKIELKSNDDGVLQLRILGVPFGGPVKSDNPEGRDLHYEYFNDETNFGDHTGVKEVALTLDHAQVKDAQGNVIMSPPDAFIGKATFTEQEEGVGRWYEAAVTAGEKYKSGLVDLYNQGLLYASSQPIMTSVTKKDGHIKSWIVSELALTTHPANVQATVEVLGKHFDEEQMEALFPGLKNVEEDTNEEETDTDLAAEIEEIFNGEAEPEEETEDTIEAIELADEVAEIKSLVKAVYNSFSVYLDMWGNLDDLSEDSPIRGLLGEVVNESMKSMQEEITSLKKANANMEAGLKVYAKMTADNIGKAVAAEFASQQNMSKAEKTAQNLKMNSTYNNGLRSPVPDHAPGSN